MYSILLTVYGTKYHARFRYLIYTGASMLHVDSRYGNDRMTKYICTLLFVEYDVLYLGEWLILRLYTVGILS